MDWMHGYNALEGYTYGYYREMDPLWLDLSAVVQGFLPPSQLYEGKLRYLELGCGQGLNLCLLSACHPRIEFVGVDYNPIHIAHANRIARIAGLQNVKFVEGDFVELAKSWPETLGKFHYVSAHGVISWISSRVREFLFRCIEQATLPGGLVYLSYNVMPGWISGLPVQHMLRLWQRYERFSNQRVLEVGYQRLAKLLEKNARICPMLPGLKGRVENLMKLDRAYLAQEYLHDEWRPFWFDEVAEECHKVKLTYLGTANSSDWFLFRLLSSEWKELVMEYDDPVLRETMIDLIVNQSFRRDIWVRGAQQTWSASARRRLLDSFRFQSLSDFSSQTEFKFQSSLGELTGKPEFYRRLYEVLAEGPKTPSELLERLGDQTRTFDEILQALGLMLNIGHVVIYKGKEEKIERASRQLNSVVISEVAEGAPYRYLVGSAIPWVFQVSDLDMMFAYVKIKNPKADAGILANSVTEKLLALGRTIVKDGKPVTEKEELRERLFELADIFLNRTLPNWQRLGIV